MMQDFQSLARREWLALAIAAAGAATVMPGAALAQLGGLGGRAGGGGIKSLLGKASDGALDKLAAPDAFFTDKAVRLLLPGPLKSLSKLLRFTSQAGLTGDLQKSMNDAAGLAAGTAKPVFRAAIDDLTLADGARIVTGGKTGATDHLRRTSGPVLGDAIRPLIADALGKVGALEQLEKLGQVRAVSRLAKVDLSPDGLIDSTRDQALGGIFTYIGREKTALRANPLGKLGRGLRDVM